MEVIAFTVVAIALYAVSDALLDRIERARGARFEENRTIVFFAIIIALAVPVFWLMQRLFAQG